MMRAYVGTPGFEAALAAELGERAPRTLAPGIVAASEREADTPPLDPVFSRQVLPAAAELAGVSVRALAEGAFTAVEGAIDRWPGRFTVHAYLPAEAPDDDAPSGLPGARAAHTRARAARRADQPAPPRRPRGEGLGGRVALVERELLALLAERRKRASRRYVPRVAPAEFDERTLLVQLLLLARDRLLASAAAPRALGRGGFDLAPWAAGAPPVADDRAPPSRAYRKLEEAFQWMGAAPQVGETVVDLGAAPGSWTLMAARRGARVIAVDRAPLAADVACAEGVTAVTGNAFTYEGPGPVDWLLSDVVCEPERALALVGAWLPRARNLVVTMKFKGRDGYGALDSLGPLLARSTASFARCKQLAHNKNEVTVMVRGAC
jgi:hypothetical protein